MRSKATKTETLAYVIRMFSYARKLLDGPPDYSPTSEAVPATLLPPLSKTDSRISGNSLI